MPAPLDNVTPLGLLFFLMATGLGMYVVMVVVDKFSDNLVLMAMQELPKGKFVLFNAIREEATLLLRERSVEEGLNRLVKSGKVEMQVFGEHKRYRLLDQYYPDDSPVTKQFN